MSTESCESCGTTRPDGAEGWIRVAWIETYCPDCYYAIPIEAPPSEAPAEPSSTPSRGPNET